MFQRLLLMALINLAANGIQAQLPSGTPLLADGITALVPTGPGVMDSVVKVVPVSGQPFLQALQVNTLKSSSGTGTYALHADVTTPLRKGDVLWIAFKARTLESKRETGEAFVEVRLDQLVNGKYLWPSYIERGISIGPAWMETSMPLVLINDVKPGDAQLVINFGAYAQRFELGPVSFINYGQNVKVADLPRSVVRYGGDEPDAPWRKAAAERIEKYRKGDLAIQVVDSKNRPLPAARVDVHMVRNAFSFGTSTSSERLLQAGSASNMYRDTLLKYFNKVVLENELKMKYWSRFNYDQTSKGIQWLKAHQMKIRAHVMVWPSWQHAGAVFASYKNDSAALRTAIFQFIKQQTDTLKGAFSEWDVVNEPYAHHDFMDILGREEMVKWFKAAHENAPGVKLFLNDYTMFRGEGPGSPSEHFFTTAKYLLNNGAPIQAIGEQGHIGGTPPSIPHVVERLDYFSKLGLPIQISEFDISSNDDAYKARYMGDFMTAVFSNPSTIGFVQWGFWEGQHWFPVAALWNKDWTVRANGKVFTELVSKTWHTDEQGLTGKNGTYAIRGFNGDYEVTVKYKGKERTEKVSLDAQGKRLTLKLDD